LVSFFIILVSAFGCSESDSFVAKPRMYPKVDFPVRNNTSLLSNDCNFTFTHPDYLQYGKDSIRFQENFKYPCWFDLNSSKLNTTLHFSFLEIKNYKDLDTHIKDAFKLADEHNIKALARKESIIDDKKNNVFGLMFEFDGDVAAPLQFFITDSSKYFLRASLYFNDKVNQDSTQIIYDYVKEDIDLIINTLQWKY
jgi:gliding motility-associated lipoprotein GldD